MKILVTFALGMEFSAWRQLHDFSEVLREPFPLYAADIGGSTVRVLLTGIGASAASEAVRWALKSPADLCISSGFAGSLRPDIGVGDVLAARVVCRAEKELAVASDRELLATACDAGARRVERFLTAERVVAGAAEKMALGNVADAVEMESFVILAEAARHGVRAVAVRATSDALATSLPYDLERVCDVRGRIRVGALAAEILRKPHRIPDLIRLGRDSRTAARSLAEFLDPYVNMLPARLDISQSEMVAAT